VGGLFTFVISLVVVGAALFLATRIAIGPAPKLDKPATPVAQSVSAPHGALEPDALWGPLKEVERVPAGRRIRSGVLLIVMLTILGAIAALVLVICGAVVLSGLRSAVQ
jgi:hypothetical protein